MDGQLTVGTVLTSECGNKYVIQKLLGAGGQGEVYDVLCGSKHYALKWYFKGSATDNQKKILDNIPINLLRSFNTSGYSFIISTTNFCSLFSDRYTPQFHYHRS